MPLVPSGGNIALAFGALLGGAVVIDYGVKNVKTGWASSTVASNSTGGPGETAASAGSSTVGKVVGAVGKPGAGTSKFSSAQRSFAAELSKDTGLNVNVIFAWMQNEQPPGSASAPNGVNNWLNVGATGSGFFGGQIPEWANPISAADETAKWMSGQAIGTGGYTNTGYEGASSGIQAILKTASGDVSAQIAAIQGSGWASGGEAAMLNIYKELTSK